jgi:hypothetical protein
LESNDLPALNPAHLSRERNQKEIRIRWQNLNAFLARLTALKIWLFHQYAIFALREALEDMPDNRSLKRMSEHPTSTTLEIDMPLAAR